MYDLGINKSITTGIQTGAGFEFLFVAYECVRKAQIRPAGGKETA